MLRGDPTAMWPKTKRIAAEPAPRPADLCDQAFAISSRILAYLIFQDDALFLGFGRESAGLVVKSFPWGNIQSPLRQPVVSEITLSRKKKMPWSNTQSPFVKLLSFSKTSLRTTARAPTPTLPGDCASE